MEDGAFARQGRHGVEGRERLRRPLVRHSVGERVALLPRGRYAGPRVRDHERDGGAASGRLDDDPAALAVAEQSEREAARAIRFEDVERGEEIAGLLGEPGLLPAPGRTADPALVERADGDPRSEQVLPDRREEHVVVPVRRPRAGMHEHARHRTACRTPERPGEPDAARVGLYLESSVLDAGGHSAILAALCPT